MQVITRKAKRVCDEPMGSESEPHSGSLELEFVELSESVGGHALSDEALRSVHILLAFSRLDSSAIQFASRVVSSRCRRLGRLVRRQLSEAARLVRCRSLPAALLSPWLLSGLLRVWRDA